MSAQQLLSYLTQILFVVVFFAALAHAVRYPRRANVDVALFFGDVTLVIAIGLIAPTLGGQLRGPVGVLSSSLLMALPYLLLRLVDDFATVPGPVLRLAEAGLVLVIAGLVLIPPNAIAPWFAVLLVAYFAAFEIYPGIVFAREARRSTGVTRRRLEAAAVGSIFLGVAIVAAGVAAVLPASAGAADVAIRLFGLASGVAYVIAFAPPALLRRAWQSPELQAFLSRAATLSQLPDPDAIRRELENGAAAALGVSTARIGLWDEGAGVLRFVDEDRRVEVRPGQFIVGRTFERQVAHFSPNAARDNPDQAEAYRRRNVAAVLAAPITAGSQPLGVLSVQTRRAPLFAEDDLALVQLLANQAAIVLDNRRLIDELARTRAREEATRLRDDFLSAAAHDLKTPLTTLLAQAQLLQRRVGREPAAPLDLVGVTRIVAEAQRLSTLVLRLLDVSLMEEDAGRTVNRESVDLVALAREACEHYPSAHHHRLVDAAEPVVGQLDRARVGQLLDSLVDNAIKFSPAGGDVRVRVWREDGEARLTVTNRGIGIPSDDLAHVFERFFRGSNVDDRRFAGMGLGLYVARQIVEEHGGRIWATSAPDHDTTIHVTLPLESQK